MWNFWLLVIALLVGSIVAGVLGYLGAMASLKAEEAIPIQPIPDYARIAELEMEIYGEVLSEGPVQGRITSIQLSVAEPTCPDCDYDSWMVAGIFEPIRQIRTHVCDRHRSG